MAEEKTKGQQLFDLLNQDYGKLTRTAKTENMKKIDALVKENPNILSSPEFGRAMVASMTLPSGKKSEEAVRRALDSIDYLRGSSHFSRIKNPRQVAKNTWLEELDRRQQRTRPGSEGADGSGPDGPNPPNPPNGPRNPNGPDGPNGPNGPDGPDGPDGPKNPNDPNNMTIDQLEVAAYQGTLTADGYKALEEKKKVADLDHTNGDPNKSQKREKAKEKFVDEDVVKYLYGLWLDLNSAVFNKAEDLILGSIDYVCDCALAKSAASSKAKQAAENAKIQEAQKRINEFRGLVGGNVSQVKAGNASQVEYYTDAFAELSANLDNPDHQWTHFKKKPEKLLAELKANPTAARQMLSEGPQVLKNLTQYVDKIYGVSAAITGVEMIDEFMRNDKKWRNPNSKQYHDNGVMRSAHDAGTRKRMNKIMEAISVTQEEARLMAEIAYDQLPDSQKSKTDRAQFIQGAISREVFGFLKTLDNMAQQSAAQQNQELADGHVDAVNNCPSSAVRHGIRKIDALIDERIASGGVIRQEESAKVQRSVDLLQAVQEGRLESYLSSQLEQVKHQEDICGQRRTDVQERKKALDAFKARIEKRDGRKSTDQRIQDISQAGLAAAAAARADSGRP